MLSTEEIDSLKREYNSLERRIGSIREGQRPTVLRLSERLKALMAEIESTIEKEKSMWNPAIITRMKIAKKGFELSKEVGYFEAEVAREFEMGNVPKDEGKRFLQITKHVKAGKMEAAKSEFRYFEDYMELSRSYERAAEDMKERERELRREQARIEKILAGMEETEKESVDAEKVRRYEELQADLERLRASREEYLHSLLSMPVMELLGEIEKHARNGYYQDFPAKEEVSQLKRFFMEYPAFAGCNAAQLCEFFGYSEKKLSHVCPETTRFRKVVMGNRNLFETLSMLHHTAFLAVDDSDEKVLDFFAQNTKDGQGIVGRIRELKKEKRAYKEEYERSRQIERRKAELSKYSKTALEKELKDTGHLLERLRSTAPAAESGGLLSGFGLALKKLTQSSG